MVLQNGHAVATVLAPVAASSRARVWLTRSAVESMARQPEIAANIQTAMIISAALIEGVTFFALIIVGFILTTY